MFESHEILVIGIFSKTLESEKKYLVFNKKYFLSV